MSDQGENVSLGLGDVDFHLWSEMQCRPLLQPM